MTMTSPLTPVRSHAALWIAAAALIAIVLSWVLPAAASYHVTAPTPQRVTGL